MSEDGPDTGYGEQRAVDEANSWVDQEDDVQPDILEEEKRWDIEHDQLDDLWNQPLMP